MSFALSQEFAEDETQGLREIVIDATMAGMGRGAGNTNTELVMQFMNRRYNSGYDIDSVLDLIDNYIDGIRNRCEWGYSVPNFWQDLIVPMLTILPIFPPKQVSPAATSTIC